MGIQLLRVAPHQHGNGPAGRLQIAPLQRLGHAAGVFVQAAGRQTEGDHDHADAPSGPIPQQFPGKPDRQRRQQAHRQDHRQAGRQTGQRHARPVGAVPEDTLRCGGQGAHAADGMDTGRGLTEQTVQQQGGGQEEQGGQHAHRHASVVAAGRGLSAAAGQAAVREGRQAGICRAGDKA